MADILAASDARYVGPRRQTVIDMMATQLRGGLSGCTPSQSFNRFLMGTCCHAVMMGALAWRGF